MLRIDGSDWSAGFNLGALLEVVDGTRVGLHYRSKTDHVLSGEAQFTGVPEPFAPVFANQGARAALPLPEIVSLSLFHELSPDLAIMADWSWWNWSRFETLAVDFENPLTPDSIQPQNWKDASIFSLGVRWRSSSALTWRAGLAYNETPVPSPAYRTARIPDSDRVWVAAGLAWRITDAVRGDVGYAHLFMEDSTTTHDDGVGHVLIGDFAAHVDIVSLQLTWSF
jgi:long-chain fatty acid transport protein